MIGVPDTFRTSLTRLGLPGKASRGPLVVAISGGPDSVVLLRLCVEQLGPERLLAAHLDHAQRKASQGDALFVSRLCRRLGVRLHTGVLDEGGGLSEETMRDRRREFLEQVALRHAAVAILTAHHADDRLETFLMRLLRGSGLEGLKSISEVSGLYARPLLSLPKAALVAYARRRRWTFRDDKSNSQPKYFRNRLRGRAMPRLDELAAEYGGKEAWLARMEALYTEIEEVESVLEADTAKRSSELWDITPYWRKLSLEKFRRLELFWQRRALRQGFRDADKKALTRRELERLLASLEREKGKVQLSNGLDVEFSMGFAFFSERSRTEGPALPKPPFDPPEGTEFRAWRAGDLFRGKPVVDRLKKKGVPAPERKHFPVMAKMGTSDVVWHPILSNDPSH